MYFYKDKSRYPTKKLFKMFNEIVGVTGHESKQENNVLRKQSIDNLMNSKAFLFIREL